MPKSQAQHHSSSSTRCCPCTPRGGASVLGGWRGARLEARPRPSLHALLAQQPIRNAGDYACSPAGTEAEEGWIRPRGIWFPKMESKARRAGQEVYTRGCGSAREGARHFYLKTSPGGSPKADKAASNPESPLAHLLLPPTIALPPEPIRSSVFPLAGHVVRGEVRRGSG